MRVQVLSPIVVGEKQYNRGYVIDVESLTDIQRASVHVIDEDAPANPKPTTTATKAAAADEVK